uniref:Uncharacterized protein n=1 Tax=Amphimedon queenslandica TaxID=400682 RepID=A0A1X7UBF4_AMPQE
MELEKAIEKRKEKEPNKRNKELIILICICINITFSTIALVCSVYAIVVIQTSPEAESPDIPSPCKCIVNDSTVSAADINDTESGSADVMIINKVLELMDELDALRKTVKKIQEDTARNISIAFDESEELIARQRQDLIDIENRITLGIDKNITLIFDLLSNFSNMEATPPQGKSELTDSTNDTTPSTVTLNNLHAFKEALTDNCTFLNLTSCTLPTTPQYGSAVPTFWSCKTSPVAVTHSLHLQGTVQCIVSEYGNEINPVAASLSLTTFNGSLEYRCLCSVVVTTTIWRKSSVTCSLIQTHCLPRESTNMTLTNL